MAKNNKVSFLFLNVRVYLSLAILLLIFISTSANASAGVWKSLAVDEELSYTIKEAEKPAKDYFGNYITVVYLEKVGFKKIGKNSNKKDVAWLLSQGYRVIEINYAKNSKAVSPIINEDIIAINDSLAVGSFCGLDDCSRYKSYVLFEGYRIDRDVPYFKDNPKVYNTPDQYTEGDTLHMDIIYPANPSVEVPIILSFSYSNSYATYDKNKGVFIDLNKDQRVNLGYTFAGFNDSFLEGAPANGIAWAIADHPKYCSWGKGKPEGGPNDAYKSYQTNPDAAQKVKSAIRTLRVKSEEFGLSGKIGIYGFSRGSDAGSMAIGDRSVPSFENAGFNIGVSDDVQAAALGPGVFDFTLIYNRSDDHDNNLETRCPWVWGPLKENYDLWKTMGSAWLVQSSATAPVHFFYNTDDQPYYQDQIAHLKEKLDSLGVPNYSLIDYGTGHAVPQTAAPLTELYDFFIKYLVPPSVE